ncbi:PLP-dependent aminotransferase family protein [Paenibacillus sp. P96]|uniref:PLP-dependent aminotransferase family protein n=1 Tax=Paenibacillus zeirhizosphaerae TaxID=2987519 RepID=A0ABT9FL32_9BACL|nr:PLP-dependent aminotransferase family protein [Paenibacillus sp. P96]MDP4095300.1 PLP-dependent aminotransferase family protein [Paenibacillus sp. P96]
MTVKAAFSADAAFKLYEQVMNYIEVRIERGEWKEHERLPSVRRLSDDLGVHRLTVFRAYQELKTKGRIYVKDKSGYYVQPPNGRVDREPAEDPVYGSWARADELSRIHSIQVDYQFSKALIDPALLPNRFWSELMTNVFREYPKLPGTYSTVQGDAELRGALADHFSNTGFDLSADELLITSGGQQAIDLTARTLIRPGDRVLVERPAYGPAMEIFRRQGARLLTVDIRPDGYDLERIEQCMRTEKPRLFYINPTFHNPTGFTIPAAQRKLLPELAERYGCVILEDDSTYDIHFGLKTPPPVFTYATTGHVIYIRSYSKYVAPGLRIAALACRAEHMPGLLAAKSLADNGSPLLNQKLFLHYFRSPRMQQHLEKLCTALQLRKETMERCLSDSGWAWNSPVGGLNLWVRLPRQVDMRSFLQAALTQSVSFIPGHVFDPLASMENPYIRLSYPFANEAQIREGMRRLLSVYESLK